MKNSIYRILCQKVAKNCCFRFPIGKFGKLLLNLCCWCNRGVLASALAFGAEGLVFVTNTGRAGTTRGESCALPTCPIIVLRGQNTCWVLCADGMKLQSLRNFRFWTSLVRNCLNYPAMNNRTCGCGILAIDLAYLRSPSDTSMSRELKTNNNMFLSQSL